MAKKKDESETPKQSGTFVGAEIQTTKERLEKRRERGANHETYWDFSIQIGDTVYVFNESDLKKHEK
jgi:hypothetical protein